MSIYDETRRSLVPERMREQYLNINLVAAKTLRLYARAFARNSRDPRREVASLTPEQKLFRESAITSALPFL